MLDDLKVADRRFAGIKRLYGNELWSQFEKSHICVVGVGGVGSWAVEALARSGIGYLTLIDLDNVAESNVNRQLHALTENFGKPKIQALAERIEQINPICQVTQIEDFVSEENLDEFFDQKFDFVIDAIDQVRVKAAMAAYFLRKKQSFVMSGGAGGRQSPASIQTEDLSRVTHDPLLANVRYTLRKRYGFSRDAGKKLCVPCVYSVEQITRPQIEGTICEQGSLQGLSCAGYGASMLVTASFGLYCAHRALDTIQKMKNDI